MNMTIFTAAPTKLQSRLLCCQVSVSVPAGPVNRNAQVTAIGAKSLTQGRQMVKLLRNKEFGFIGEQL